MFSNIMVDITITDQTKRGTVVTQSFRWIVYLLWSNYVVPITVK